MYEYGKCGKCGKPVVAKHTVWANAVRFIALDHGEIMVRYKMRLHPKCKDIKVEKY